MILNGDWAADNLFQLVPFVSFGMTYMKFSTQGFMHVKAVTTHISVCHRITNQVLQCFGCCLFHGSVTYVWLADRAGRDTCFKPCPPKAHAPSHQACIPHNIRAPHQVHTQAVQQYGLYFIQATCISNHTDITLHGPLVTNFCLLNCDHNLYTTCHLTSGTNLQLARPSHAHQWKYAEATCTYGSLDHNVWQ